MTLGAFCEIVVIAYWMPFVYAAWVAVEAHAATPWLVAMFGSESGSMMSTIGIFPSYLASSAAIGSTKLCL